MMMKPSPPPTPATPNNSAYHQKQQSRGAKLQTSTKKQHRLRDVSLIEEDFAGIENRRRIVEERQAASNMSMLFAKKRKTIDDLNLDDGEAIRDPQEVIQFATLHAQKASKYNPNSIVSSSSVAAAAQARKRRQQGNNTNNNNNNADAFGDNLENANNNSMMNRRTSIAHLIHQSTSMLQNVRPQSAMSSNSNNNNDTMMMTTTTGSNTPQPPPANKGHVLSSNQAGRTIYHSHLSKKKNCVQLDKIFNRGGGEGTRRKSSNPLLSHSGQFSSSGGFVSNNSSNSFSNNNNNSKTSASGLQTAAHSLAGNNITNTSATSMHLDRSQVLSMNPTMMQGNPYEMNAVVMLKKRAGIPPIVRTGATAEKCNVWEEDEQEIREQEEKERREQQQKNMQAGSNSTVNSPVAPLRSTTMMGMRENDESLSSRNSPTRTAENNNSTTIIDIDDDPTDSMKPLFTQHDASKTTTAFMTGFAQQLIALEQSSLNSVASFSMKNRRFGAEAEEQSSSPERDALISEKTASFNAILFGGKGMVKAASSLASSPVAETNTDNDNKNNWLSASNFSEANNFDPMSPVRRMPISPAAFNQLVSSPSMSHVSPPVAASMNNNNKTDDENKDDNNHDNPVEPSMAFFASENGVSMFDLEAFMAQDEEEEEARNRKQQQEQERQRMLAIIQKNYYSSQTTQNGSQKGTENLTEEEIKNLYYISQSRSRFISEMPPRRFLLARHVDRLHQSSSSSSSPLPPTPNRRNTSASGSRNHQIQNVEQQHQHHQGRGLHLVRKSILNHGASSTDSSSAHHQNNEAEKLTARNAPSSMASIILPSKLIDPDSTVMTPSILKSTAGFGTTTTLTDNNSDADDSPPSSPLMPGYALPPGKKVSNSTNNNNNLPMTVSFANFDDTTSNNMSKSDDGGNFFSTNELRNEQHQRSPSPQPGTSHTYDSSTQNQQLMMSGSLLASVLAGGGGRESRQQQNHQQHRSSSRSESSENIISGSNNSHQRNNHNNTSGTFDRTGSFFGGSLMNNNNNSSPSKMRSRKSTATNNSNIAHQIKPNKFIVSTSNAVVSPPNKIRMSKEIEYALIQGSKQRQRQEEEEEKLRKAIEEAKFYARRDEKILEKYTLEILDDDQKEQEENEETKRKRSPSHESSASATNACRADVDPPDWLYRARYRNIRNMKKASSLSAAMTMMSSNNNNKSKNSHHHHYHPSSLLSLNPEDFYLCVQLVKTRFQNTSLANWVFNCEIRQQEFQDDDATADRRILFAGLQLDPENFLIFDRKFIVGNNSSDDRHNQKQKYLQQQREKKSSHHHQKTGRIFSPLEDLPWLKEELLLQSDTDKNNESTSPSKKISSCSLLGNQLRIIVQAVFPIRETIVNSTVQF